MIQALSVEEDLGFLRARSGFAREIFVSPELSWLQFDRFFCPHLGMDWSKTQKPCRATAVSRCALHGFHLQGLTGLRLHELRSCSS